MSTLATCTPEERKAANDYIGSLVFASGGSTQWDASRPIKSLWKAIDDDFERGVALRAKRGDAVAQAQAYIYLLRHVEAVLVHIKQCARPTDSKLVHCGHLLNPPTTV
jgi:hypothetical protein